MAPTNTPAALPPRLAGAIPACSKASQASSSTSRCCGSIAVAARGEMPKNAASKRSTSSRNPPRRTSVAAGSHRPAGTSVIALRPSVSSRQKAAGPSAPGRRQESPTTATGSPGVLAKPVISRSIGGRIPSCGRGGNCLDLHGNTGVTALSTADRSGLVRCLEDSGGPGDGQRVDPVVQHVVAQRNLLLRDREPKRREAREERLEPHLHREAGQVLADALVHAVAERDVALG